MTRHRTQYTAAHVLHKPARNKRRIQKFFRPSKEVLWIQTEQMFFWREFQKPKQTFQIVKSNCITSCHGLIAEMAKYNKSESPDEFSQTVIWRVVVHINNTNIQWILLSINTNIIMYKIINTLLQTAGGSARHGWVQHDCATLWPHTHTHALARTYTHRHTHTRARGRRRVMSGHDVDLPRILKDAPYDVVPLRWCWTEQQPAAEPSTNSKCRNEKTLRDTIIRSLTGVCLNVHTVYSH